MASVVKAQKVKLDTQLVACRVCLATDTKLFYLPTHPLARTFDILTGTPFSAADGLPQYICVVCSHLLVKYSSLRSKCRIAKVIFQVVSLQNQSITTEHLRILDRTNLKHSLLTANTQTIDIIPRSVKKSDNNINKNDNYIDCDQIYDESIIDCGDHDTCLPDCLIGGILKDKNIDLSEIYSLVCEPIAKGNTNLNIPVPINKKASTKVNTQDRDDNIAEVESKETPKKGKKRIRILKDARKEKLVAISKSCNFDIVLLNKEEQRQQIEARKETTIYLNAKFKCQVCFRGFSEESKFSEHMLVHDPKSGEFHCDVCQCYFAVKRDHAVHCKRHKMNLICKECKNVTNTVTKAKLHFKWHKGEMFKCEHCGKCFNKSTSRRNHQRTHHASAPCVICGMALMGEKGLLMHMNKSHKEAVDAVCSTCSVQFHSAEALSKHACEPGALPCVECGENFSTEELLKQHRIAHHKKQYNCKICSDTFQNANVYREHCLSAHRVKVPRVAPPNRQLHLGKIRCMCEVCGRHLQSQAALRMHQLIHTGEKPFQCDRCPKTFRLLMQLQHHTNTHTGARPFKCAQCPQAFASPASHYKHRLVHTKEKRYACELCGKTYTQPYSVRMHIRTAHLKEPWPKRVRPSRINTSRQ